MEASFPRGSLNLIHKKNLKQFTKPAPPKSKKKRSRDEHNKNDEEEDDNQQPLFGTRKVRRHKSLNGKSKRRNEDQEEEEGLEGFDARSISRSGSSKAGGVIGGDEGAGQLAFITAVGFGTLAKGTKLLGIAKEVKEEYATFVLPGMLTGFVRRGKNDPPLSSILSPQTMMATYVLNASYDYDVDDSSTPTKLTPQGPPRRRIELSLHPRHLNAGTMFDQLYAHRTIRGRIHSMQDHGCLVDVAIDGVTAFLPYKAIKDAQNENNKKNNTNNYKQQGEDQEDMSLDGDDKNTQHEQQQQQHPSTKFQQGAYHDFFITQCTTTTDTPLPTTTLQLGFPTRKQRRHLLTHAVNRTASQKQLSSLGKYATSHTLTSLQPGMLVRCIVEEFAKNGLCVSFLHQVFHGAIEIHHLGAYYGGDALDGWRNTLMHASRATVLKMDARIVYIDSAAKIVRLSLLNHVLDLRGPNLGGLPEVGTVVKRGKVMWVDRNFGAVLSIPKEFLPEDRQMEADESDSDDESDNDANKSSNSDSEDDSDSDSDSDHKPSKSTKKTKSPKRINDLLSIPAHRTASQNKTLYVHISKCIDSPSRYEALQHETNSLSALSAKMEREAAFAKQFRMGGTVPLARIVGSHAWMDGCVLSGSTAPAVVNAAVLTHADCTPGQVYRNVPIVAHKDFGVLVALGDGVLARCVPLHLLDQGVSGKGGSPLEELAVTSPKVAAGYRKKLEVGQKVDVRCLHVDGPQRKCLVTMKPSLVKDDSKYIVTSWEDEKLPPPDAVVKGYVTSCNKKRVGVQFYNEVYGFCSALDLARELGVEHPTTNYKVGEVVKCRVLGKMDWMHGTCLKLSFQLSGSEEQPTLDHGLELGAVLPKGGKIVQLMPSEESRNGMRWPGYAIVSFRLPTKDEAYSNKKDKKRRKKIVVECRLPFDQLLDYYNGEPGAKAKVKQNAAVVDTPEALDEVAKQHLKVGKKLQLEAAVIGFFRSNTKDPVITIKSEIVQAIQAAQKSNEDGNDQEEMDTEEADRHSKQKTKQSAPLFPKAIKELFLGATVVGYVKNIHNQYGAFVNFMGDMNGFISCKYHGLDVNLYDTIRCTVEHLEAGDAEKGVRISIKPLEEYVKTATRRRSHKVENIKVKGIQVGEDVGSVEVEEVSFESATVKLLSRKYRNLDVRASIHSTMAEPSSFSSQKKKKSKSASKNYPQITPSHPFYRWKTGKIVENVTCVALHLRGNVTCVELSNRDWGSIKDHGGVTIPPDVGMFNPDPLEGQAVHAIVMAALPPPHHGLNVLLPSGDHGFMPALDLSDDVSQLNNLKASFPVGSCVSCVVMGTKYVKSQKRNRSDSCDSGDSGEWTKTDYDLEPVPLRLSALRCQEGSDTSEKECRVVVGRVNRERRTIEPPALLLDLRENTVGRCCITEVDDVDEWQDMPFGSAYDTSSRFPHGKYVRCRLLPGEGQGAAKAVSLRKSRLKGDLEDDKVPEKNDVVRAFIVETNNRGCFVVFSRSVIGRVLFKNLSDTFVADPRKGFPSEKMVEGKVMDVREGRRGIMVNLNLRDSVIGKGKVKYEDLKVGDKYKGVVTRVERYGVLLRLNDSAVTGLAPTKQCSDEYISNAADVYEAGDLVKAIVLEIDPSRRRVSFGLKASYFEGDADSEEDSDADSSVTTEESVVGAVEVKDSSNDEDSDNEGEEDSSDSEDEKDEESGQFIARKSRAAAGDSVEVDESSDESSDSDDSGIDSDSDSSSSADQKKKYHSNAMALAMDTDVGFDWNQSEAGRERSRSDSVASSSSDDDSSQDSDDDEEKKSSHKGRKKAAKKRKEEQATFQRETALADGTADANPETSKDFERLIAGEPNRSEYWIKYMAYHLSIADVDGARNVADRAFERIEFRQEGEKLNVWTALLTLELKYGSDETLKQVINRACKQNNPKQVYLRVCEMLEREVEAARGLNPKSKAEATQKADDMFSQMCKKFKSKKTTWLAYLRYLTRDSRPEEAQELLRRSLKSLPQHKHVETVTKFGQLEFEYGNVERARALFDALVEKHPKRLDLIFVYVDKEIKGGDLEAARAVFRKVVKPPEGRKIKFNDKQMKSLFKKWYRMEEKHGDNESQEAVKNEARSYVGRSSGSG